LRNSGEEIVTKILVLFGSLQGFILSAVIFFVNNIQGRNFLQDFSLQFDLLCKAMETEKLYLDPDLNQQKFSRHTGIQARSISTIFSKVYQGNFNDFTISAIAFESGFNSNATFQRVFRSKVETSPSLYANLGETAK
jgi:AraC-like DNA-binding protein